jgi:hypothetical protein
MEELIFFAVIIFFSIIESIARSRKAKQGEGEEQGMPLPDLPAPEPWEPVPSDVDIESYDEEPTHDEIATSSRTTESPPERATGPRRTSAETMLPGDLLEELAGLAGRLEKGRARPAPHPHRGTYPPLPAPTPPPAPRHKLPAPRFPSPVEKHRARLPEVMPEAHEVHLSHWDYGTDPSQRAPSREGVIDPFAERHDPDAAAVTRQLRSRSRSALRRAIILHDVLGPPMALREDRFQD